MLFYELGKRIFTSSREKPGDDKYSMEVGISALVGAGQGVCGQWLFRTRQGWAAVGRGQAIVSRMSHCALFLFPYGLGTIQGEPSCNSVTPDMSRPVKESSCLSREEQRSLLWAGWAGLVRPVKTPTYRTVTWGSLSGTVPHSSTLS